MKPLRLAYLVHDLDDPAVARRLAMLRPHLASAVVAGFFRGAAPPAHVAGWPVIALGRTADSRMGQRLGAILSARLRLGRLAQAVTGCDAVLSRQIETLPLALAARDRFAPRAPVVQEVLDLHRLLLAPGLAGTAIRAVERHLLARCEALVVSAPAFVERHLAPLLGDALPPIHVIENKVLAAEAPGAMPPCGSGPPWQIGWFGVLRCRRSLHLLANLARPGVIEVELRGRPALSAIPDFDAVVAATPGLRFSGPYDRAHDLPAMHAGLHFTWMMDFFEAGGNSDWLLPNRLYEGPLHGAVPIALGSVASGAWLARYSAGLLLREPLEATLPRAFAALDAAGWAGLARAVAALPRAALVEDGQDATALAARLSAGRRPNSPPTA